MKLESNKEYMGNLSLHKSVVQNENCFAEEIKEVELRSRRGKFIYSRTYNPVGFNEVSHFSRLGRAPSRRPMKKSNICYRKHGKWDFLYGRELWKDTIVV